MALRILFLGTPAFAVPTLQALLASDHPVVGVVTQPDRRQGRGHRVASTPVKAAALDHGLSVFQYERLKGAEVETLLRAAQADLGVVAAFGQILSSRMIALPRLGMINVHASLLPRWRGAAPVHRAILAGDAATGISIMRVVRALDAGPVLARESTPIAPDETSGELEGRLAILGARLLVGAVDALDRGSVDEHPQDPAAATYAARLEPGERAIDWSRPARDIHNQVRGLQPWPGAAVMLAGRRTTLLESRVLSTDRVDHPPSTIVGVQAEGIDVACRPGVLRVRRVRVAGRSAMAVESYLRGQPVIVGETVSPVPEAGADTPS